MLWIIIGVVCFTAGAVAVFVHQPNFGKTPQGKRLERVKNSPNYRNGKFQNKNEIMELPSDRSFANNLTEVSTPEHTGARRPAIEFPVIKNNLLELNRQQDLLVWFGHSSYLIQTDGKRILVDPVFCKASPIPFINDPFTGTDIYKPEDIPDIDYLFISHDHWDHMDYETLMNLKSRTQKIICGLGVGEHFEYWGFDMDRVIELDWDENVTLNEGFSVYCLPTRHFSGRGLSRDQSLWASYMLQTPTQKIYIGGDGGYDSHFAKIGNRFKDIDLAILENGQYNRNWKYIHLMPEDLVQAMKDLKAKKLLTVHHLKYALANHSWEEPLVKISEAAERESFNLITPMIGELVYWNDSIPHTNKWWEEYIQ